MAAKRKPKKQHEPEPVPNDGLTTRQRRFVAEYLVSGNATDASRRAGYSERTANVQGPRLLVNVRVAEAIKAAEQARFQRLQMTGDEVLAELAHLSRSRLTNYVSYGSNKRMRVTPSSRLTDAQAAALKSIKETETVTDLPKGGTKTKRTLEFTLHDKVAPLKALGSALGVLKEQTDVKLDVEPEARESIARKLADLASRRDAELSRAPDGEGSKSP